MVSQARLAKVLVNGGSTLDIIFTSTLESIGYDMTSLLPSDHAFYGIIPGVGSTPVGWVTLPVTFGTWENYRTEYVNFEVASLRLPTTPSWGDHLSPNSWRSPTTHTSS